METVAFSFEKSNPERLILPEVKNIYADNYKAVNARPANTNSKLDWKSYK